VAELRMRRRIELFDESFQQGASRLVFRLILLTQSGGQFNHTGHIGRVTSRIRALGPLVLRLQQIPVSPSASDKSDDGGQLFNSMEGIRYGGYYEE